MKINELLGIKYPIFQGAMAQIATHELVSAVSEAGGLGIIASAGMSPEELRLQIRKVRTHTDNPFGVNLMLMSEGIDALVDVIIEEKVPVVTTGAGTPKRFMPKFKEAGIKVIPVIPNAKLAKKMEDLGCDAVIAEGCEAGGHIGSVTSMVLWPSVLETVDIPVIFAGGIASATGVKMALDLGASGVQCGTIFLATNQCPVHDNYKQKVIEANDTSTVVTGNLYGHPVRVLSNEMTQDYFTKEKEGASLETLEKLTQGGLQRAVQLGDVDTGSLMCGQSAALVHEIKPVSDVIEMLMKKV